MPLRVIILSAIWGILSTVFIRPWFYLAIKKKNLEDKYGFLDTVDGSNFSKEKVFVYEAFIFIIVFIYSIVHYLVFSCRYNIYGSFFIIMIVAFMQLIHNNPNMSSFFILIIVLICSFVFWIEDGFQGDEITIPFERVEEVDFSSQKYKIEKDENNENTTVAEATLYFSNDAIKAAFNVDNVEDPVVSNNRIIYSVSGGKNGLGVVYIRMDNPSKAYFVPCKYDLGISQIRKFYPDDKLVKVKIAMDDDNVPYGIYALAERKFLEPFRVEKYILMNLTDGELTEYTLTKLPEFVTEK